jgi:hypothetical protein
MRIRAFEQPRKQFARAADKDAGGRYSHSQMVLTT